MRLGPRGTALWSGAWWIVATALFAVVSVPVAAVNALIASNPTQPLPPEYPDDKAFFTVTFYYNESPGR